MGANKLHQHTHLIMAEIVLTALRIQMEQEASVIRGDKVVDDAHTSPLATFSESPPQLPQSIGARDYRTNSGVSQDRCLHRAELVIFEVILPHPLEEPALDKYQQVPPGAPEA
jgi:hypothetical protein